MSTAEQPELPQQAQQAQPKDPMKGFRGIVFGALLLEAITVGLALPVIDKLGSGLGSTQGWVAGAVIVALLACCAFVRRRWITWVVLALQVVLIGFFVTLTALGIIGVVFLAVWLYLFWLRGKIARRLADGTLPSQQLG